MKGSPSRHSGFEERIRRLERMRGSEWYLGS